jgi:uncharacterized protein (UPF0179 family)
MESILMDFHKLIKVKEEIYECPTKNGSFHSVEVSTLTIADIIFEKPFTKTSSFEAHIP